MYYNLQDFGKEMRNIRNNLGFTQKYISELSGIHVDTLRKIENGKTCPVQETLDLLSPILNKDLNQLLLNYRLNDYLAFEEIQNRLEFKIDRGIYESLSVELNDLKKLLNIESNTYFTNLINQLILLVESIILNQKHNHHHKSLNKLVEAIQITNKDFTLNNYGDLVYSSMELRILMNIALLKNRIKSTEKSLEIMEFCISIANTNNNLYIKICYNLSYTYHRLDIHDKSLKYSSLGVDYCINHRDYNILNLLYFRKGIAQYFLGYKNYMDYLKKSISFCEILEQYELRDLLIRNCKKFYDIDIK